LTYNPTAKTGEGVDGDDGIAPTKKRSELMPGDPKECRGHALRCAELAMKARTPQLKVMFLELSKNWEKLAIQLENAVAKVSESQDLRCRVREALDETTRLSNLPFWNLIGID
jgi:hypothetical protein